MPFTFYNYNPRGKYTYYIHHSITSSKHEHPKNYLGKVYGLRCYNLEEEYLIGGYGKRWYSPRQKAKCNKHTYMVNNPPPHKNELCGINMYFLPDLDDYLTLNRSFDIVAITEGWGKVIEMSLGYRVQQALVTHLTTIFNGVIFPGFPLKIPPGWEKRGVRVIQSQHELEDVIASRKEARLPCIPDAEVGENSHDAG